MAGRLLVAPYHLLVDLALGFNILPVVVVADWYLTDVGVVRTVGRLQLAVHRAVELVWWRRSLLWQAARDGDAERCTVLLDRGYNMENRASLTNETPQNAGTTPLLVAVREGHLGVVLVLLERGADVNQAKDGGILNGATPLFMACSNGHAEIVAMLLEKGADIHKATNAESIMELGTRYAVGGVTSLHAACWNGQPEIVAMLLDKGADIHKATNNGATSLYAACLAVNYWPIFRAPNAHLSSYDLMMRCCISDLEHILPDMVARILEEGANHPEPVVIQNGHPEIVAMLLDKGANVDEVDDKGYTPLFRASQKGDLEVVAMLLDKGADIDKAAEDGGTSLRIACLKGHLEVAAMLLDKGADIDKTTDRFGERDTYLHIACLRGHLEVAAMLLEKGADIDKANNDGFTPLHMACQNGHLEIVAMLLEKGADIGKANNDGFTPLHEACRNVGNLEVPAMLLEKGADIDKATHGGSTPLHIALHHVNLEVAAMLLEKGADIDRADSQEYTPLHYASRHGHAAIAASIADQGGSVSVNNTTTNGDTPLLLACMKSHACTALALLEAGANPLAMDRYGWHALHYAALEGSVDTMDTLITPYPAPATWHAFLMGCGSPRELANRHQPPAGRAPARLPMLYVRGVMGVIWGMLHKSGFVAVTDLDTPDPRGHTAVALARSKGHEATAAVLIRAGAVSVPAAYPNGLVPMQFVDATQ